MANSQYFIGLAFDFAQAITNEVVYRIMYPIKQAVILAGGLGIRLRPLTYDNPKPMVRVNGRPFIDYLIEDILKPNGIEELVVLLGYLPEKVKEYLGDGTKFGIKVKYSESAVEDGTGTRVRKAANLLENNFFLLYCDNYLRVNLEELWKFHEAHNALATMTVYSNNYGFTKNNVLVGDNGYVAEYDKERKKTGLNGVDVGFFAMSKKVLDLMPAEENFYIHEKIFPLLIERRQLAGFGTDKFYYSLSTPERHGMAERFLDRGRKVIFFDRDGVINKKAPAIVGDADYIKNWGEFEFLPGVPEAIKLLTENGYEIYVISNQSGIGRGKMTEVDLFQIHKNMEGEINKNGGKISAIYYCPHAWDAGCLCRKPKPGMFHRAEIDHQIDLSRAVFIGDDPRDKEAGDAAGVRTILFKEGQSLLDIVKSLVISH